jgi:hypothetical protein
MGTLRLALAGAILGVLLIFFAVIRWAFRTLFRS